MISGMLLPIQLVLEFVSPFDIEVSKAYGHAS